MWTIDPFYALVIADSIARHLYDIWVFIRCTRCTTGTMWALTGAALAPALTWKNCTQRGAKNTFQGPHTVARQSVNFVSSKLKLKLVIKRISPSTLGSGPARDVRERFILQERKARKKN